MNNFNKDFYGDWIPLTRGEEILATPFYVKKSGEYDNYFKLSEFANWLVIASHNMSFTQRESYDDKVELINKFLKMSLDHSTYDYSMFRYIFRIVELMIFLHENGYTGTAKRITQTVMADLETLRREIIDNQKVN